VRPARSDRWWAVVAAFVATTVYGALVAVRDQLDGRPLGVGVPWPVWVQTLTWGTALSAPPVGLVLLGIAVATRSMRLITVLAATFLVGVLMEPNTWHTLARPVAWPARTLALVLLVVLPATMLVLAITSIRRPATSH
jgi:hypothetical protein